MPALTKEERDLFDELAAHEDIDAVIVFRGDSVSMKAWPRTKDNEALSAVSKYLSENLPKGSEFLVSVSGGPFKIE